MQVTTHAPTLCVCVSKFDVWVTTTAPAHKAALSLPLSIRVGGNFFRTLTFSIQWIPFHSAAPERVKKFTVG